MSFNLKPRITIKMNSQLSERYLDLPTEQLQGDLERCASLRGSDKHKMPKLDVSKYQATIKKELGLDVLAEHDKGGFGVVYKGQLQDKFGVKHDCAIKVLTAKRSLVKDLAWFERSATEEIAYLRGLFHPNILELYDYRVVMHPQLRLPCHAIIVTEFLDYSLQQLWDKRDRRPLDWRLVQQVGRDIGSALAYLHHRKIVHHDVKTMNIMSNSAGTFKLIDFGLARSYHQPMRDCMVAADPRGTKFYQPPEVTTCQQTGREYNPFLVDCYALGMTLACVLLGRERVKSLDNVCHMADLFALCFLEEGNQPPRRLIHLQAIYHLLSPFDPGRRLFIDQFLCFFF